MAYVYRVEYTSRGQRVVVKTYPSQARLERGTWISVEGVSLIVEYVRSAKRGDPHDGIAFCKPVTG